MMFPDDDMSAGETAVSYTDEFLDAAVAKIDATFGKGYAKSHPELVAGYLQASATNLAAFMTAAANMGDFDMDDALAEAFDQMEQEGALLPGLGGTMPAGKKGRN